MSTLTVVSIVFSIFALIEIIPSWHEAVAKFADKLIEKMEK